MSRAAAYVTAGLVVLLCAPGAARAATCTARPGESEVAANRLAVVYLHLNGSGRSASQAVVRCVRRTGRRAPVFNALAYLPDGRRAAFVSQLRDRWFTWAWADELNIIDVVTGHRLARSSFDAFVGYAVGSGGQVAWLAQTAPTVKQLWVSDTSAGAARLVAEGPGLSRVAITAGRLRWSDGTRRRSARLGTRARALVDSGCHPLAGQRVATISGPVRLLAEHAGASTGSATDRLIACEHGSARVVPAGTITSLGHPGVAWLAQNTVTTVELAAHRTEHHALHPGGAATLSQLAIGSRGRAAWVADYGDFSVLAAALYPRARTIVVDDGPTGTMAGLLLGSKTLLWQHAGAPRMMALGAATPCTGGGTLLARGPAGDLAIGTPRATRTSLSSDVTFTTCPHGKPVRVTTEARTVSAGQDPQTGSWTTRTRVTLAALTGGAQVPAIVTATERRSGRSGLPVSVILCLVGPSGCTAQVPVGQAGKVIEVATAASGAAAWLERTTIGDVLFARVPGAATPTRVTTSPTGRLFGLSFTDTALRWHDGPVLNEYPPPSATPGPTGA